jgi:hypothetical protein
LRVAEHLLPTVASRLPLEMGQKTGRDELAVAGEKAHEIVAAADAEARGLA